MRAFMPFQRWSAPLAAVLLLSVPAAAQPRATTPTAPSSLRPIDPILPVDPDPDPNPSPDPTPNPTPPATGSQLCAADLNGNGDAGDPGEMATCEAVAGGGQQCPLERVACTLQAPATYTCPLGAQYACAVPAGQTMSTCSPHQCADPAGQPFVTEPPIEDPGAAPDGVVDAEGNCLGTIEIFSGRGMRCRPPGIANTLSNCCKDKGKIIKDGMGSSLSSLSTKIAVAKGVFNGMQAAFTAFQAGASASAAASAGANALIIGFDPTSIAISLAVNFMVEVLLQGCDQQDMETGMLRGSGMCHEVGSYCSVSFLGVCLQKAKSHCCFNTKLGRIIQEQGRPQLRSFNQVGWGPVKHPMCRGFTPEEFQALDFSKIDLSEYYADIEARAQADIQIDMQDRVETYLRAIQ